MKKFCQQCGNLAAIYEPTGISGIDRAAWLRFIPVKFCPDCAAERKTQMNAIRQHRFRKSQKELRAEIRTRDKALQQGDKALEAYRALTAELRGEIARLKEQGREAYRPQDTRRGGISFFRH